MSGTDALASAAKKIGTPTTGKMTTGCIRYPEDPDVSRPGVPRPRPGRWPPIKLPGPTCPGPWDEWPTCPGPWDEWPTWPEVPGYPPHFPLPDYVHVMK